MAKPIRMPGMAPAMNILPTDIPESAPTMIMGMLGGIMGPTVDDAAVTAAENAGVYPARTMPGIIMPPIDAASATAVPEIPPNSIEPATLVRPRPPRTVHQISRKNKARNAQKNKDIHPSEHLLRDDDQRNAFKQEIAKRGKAKCYSNRKADNKTHGKNTKENSEAHGTSFVVSSGLPSDTPVMTRIIRKTAKRPSTARRMKTVA